jgi:hypothetical protein
MPRQENVLLAFLSFSPYMRAYPTRGIPHEPMRIPGGRQGRSTVPRRLNRRIDYGAS